MSLKDKARQAGFIVSEKRVKYATLLGGNVDELRITGYLPGGNAKISYSERGSKSMFSVTLSGQMASRSIAEKIERLGGSVDLEEGKRLYAVFRGITRGRAGSIVESLFGSRNTRLGEKARGRG
ncbi:MAG: hypothetical protein F7C34_00490 [Desulfurococcales archaeon]|nr:hypothetical protein [Desulfurococcales archaeon]